jgi:hypothetical protein
MFGEMAMDTTFPSTGVPYLRVVLLFEEPRVVIKYYIAGCLLP